ncbi:MAG: hypothetical protein E2P06_06560 [Acidobacteria bacterium]|nr:MAG: hypothetical protein E2P06_06560 [Acidobacteriota bacterium]
MTDASAASMFDASLSVMTTTDSGGTGASVASTGQWAFQAARAVDRAMTPLERGAGEAHRFPPDSCDLTSDSLEMTLYGVPNSGTSCTASKSTSDRV